MNSQNLFIFTGLMSRPHALASVWILLFIFISQPLKAEDLTKDLINALMKSDNDAIEVVLKKGVDVNSKTGKGVTPLMIASLQGNITAVNALLKKGASVNEKDSSGLTALMAAAKLGHLEIVKILVSHNADTKMTSLSGKSALDQAREAKKKDIEEYLEGK